MYILDNLCSTNIKHLVGKTDKQINFKLLVNLAVNKVTIILMT